MGAEHEEPGRGPVEVKVMTTKGGGRKEHDDHAYSTTSMLNIHCTCGQPLADELLMIAYCQTAVDCLGP